MSFVRPMLWSLLVCLALRAEDDQILPDEAAGLFRTWMQDNVDGWIFEVAGIDREAVDQSLQVVQEELKAVRPSDTGPCREDAEQMLLVLKQFEGVRPYALRLHSFLDEHRIQPRSTNSVQPAPGSPTTERMREFWLSVMTNRPAPARANHYITQIKPIFQAERVPPQLAWLAEVESSFDPHARSPVGAVGLFQLMPETARSLGLSTWFPDERQNAEKNACAAARYLRHLHDRFGDWRLALAAYNAGPTRVSKLLKKSDSYSYDAIAPQLPSETRDYVAKVEAILFVREGVTLASLQHAHG